MPFWVLDCKHCGKSFDFAETKKPELVIDIGDKPAFPEGGHALDCPHCSGTATYQRYMLRFQADRRTQSG
jgi:hypothetical protein